MMVHYNEKIKQEDSQFIRQLMSNPLLEKEEEAYLVDSWQNHHDEAAFHKLVESFSRLVVSIAVRFRYYNIPLSDLIHEGILGLMHAADRFCLEKDTRFSSYAKWWIRANIQDYVLRNWSIVRAGSTATQKQLFFSLRRIKSKLTSIDFGRLSDDEKEKIAKQFNLSTQYIEDMEQRLLQSDYSLNQPVQQHNTIEWQDLLSDQDANPEHSLEQSNALHWQRFWLKTALAHLTQRERHIIELRHLSSSPETLESLSQKLKISRERVRQIESHALRKMKHALTSYIAEIREAINT